MRAIAYIRVSTEDQKRDGYSPAQQRRDIDRYAQANGLTLVDVVEDLDVSAGTPLTDRPGGRRLFAAIAKPAKVRGIDAVIIAAGDRMFRNVIEGLQFLDWSGPRDLRLISLREVIDTSTATGRFQATIVLAAGEYERNRLRERTRDAMAEMKAQGRVVGSIPFGCRSRDVRNERGEITERWLMRDRTVWPRRERIVALYRRGLPDGTRVGFGNLRKYIALQANDPTLYTAGGSRWWSKATLKSLHDTHDRLRELPFADDVTAAALT